MNRPAWQQHGACVDYDPDRWFPDKGQPTAPAKAICATCPVKEPCLAFALADRSTVGIWGGTTARERREQRRLNSRGQWPLG